MRPLFTVLSASLAALALSFGVVTPATAAQARPQLEAASSGNSVALVGTAHASTVAAAPAATGATYFVDCSAVSAGTGTSGSPWNSLTAVNAVSFGAGDHILFKKGTTCSGALTPKGSGVAGAPIVIDSYGAADAAPLLAGGGVPATVQLTNQEYWEIRNLEITNLDPDVATRYTQPRRGVVIALKDFGQADYIRIVGLNIHDVYGQNKKDLGGSGGIQLEVDASDDPAARVKSWFNDVVIADNRVVDVNRSGINMSTRWYCRFGTGCFEGGLEWVGSTGLLISGNHVERAGGDGIVVQMNKGALVEHNTVLETSNRFGNGSNAALWAWNADDTVFQYNEVAKTKKLSDNNDGMAFDADFGTWGTVYQYNYSHDNEGGMILFCGCATGGYAVTATVRYNVSENDLLRTNFVAGGTQVQFYNNTILLPDRAIPPNDVNQNGTSLLVANNLWIARTAVADESATNTAQNNILWRSNAFSGPGGTWPADARAVTIAETLPLATGVGLDRFRISDPRLAGKGIPIAEPGVQDLFGNAVPSTCAPDIGAFQFSAVPDNCGLVNASISAGASSADIPVRPNTTYRVTATLPAGASLAVTNPRGFKTLPQPNKSVVFTTAMDATTVKVDCAGDACSNVTMTSVQNLVVDASFDSKINTPWSTWNTSRSTTSTFTVAGSTALRVNATGASEQIRIAVRPNTAYTLGGWVASSDGAATHLGVKDSINGPALEAYAVGTSATMSYLTKSFNSGASSLVSVYCYRPAGTGSSYCDDITLTADADDPYVVRNPESTTVTPSHEGYFKAAFAGAPLAPVRWQQLNGDTWVDIAGSLGNALTTPAGSTSGTQYRAALEAPTGRLFSQPATLTVQEPGQTGDTLDLQPTVSQRCVAGKANLVVSVRNADDVAADVTIASVYGSKTIPSVKAGGSATASFATRSASIGTGTVSVTGSAGAATYDGTVSYPAHTCG